MCVILPRVAVVVITYTKTLEAKKADTYGSTCIKGQTLCCPPLFLAANISLNISIENWIMIEFPPPSPQLFFSIKNIKKLWISFFFILACQSRLFRMSPLPPPYEQVNKVNGRYSPPPPGKQNKIITPDPPRSRLHVWSAHWNIWLKISVLCVYVSTAKLFWSPPPTTLLNIGTLIKFKSCIGVCIIFKILFSVALTWIKWTSQIIFYIQLPGSYIY